MQEQDLFKTLNTIFTNEDYLFDIATYGNKFIYGDLMYSLNRILCYYLATRDSGI